LKIFSYFAVSTLFLLLFTIFFYEKVLISYAKFFKVDNATKGADIILILAGNTNTRVKKAIELYENNYSKAVAMTTTKAIKNPKYSFLLSDFNLTKEMLLDSDIEPLIISSIKDGATSTFDEAIDLLNSDLNLSRVILVTDSFHSRRARYAFEKIFDDTNVTFEVASATNRIYNESNWYKTEAGLSSYISEGFKFIIYILNSKNIEGVEEI